MANKNVLIYDAYSSPLNSKKDFADKLATYTDNLYYITAKNFSDGVVTDNVLSLFREGLDLVLIWNGFEIGCGLIEEYCKRYGVEYCYIEQGLLPQNKTIFFSKYKEKFLRENLLEIDYRYKCTPKHSEEYEERLLNFYPIANKEKKEGKIVIPMQVSFDASLRGMKNPKKEFFKYITDRIENDFEMSKCVPEIHICPHPKRRGDYKNFDLTSVTNLDANFKVSNKPTLQEASDASFVVGYNSTTLYECALLNFNVKSVCFDDNILKMREGFIRLIMCHQLFADDFSEDDFNKMIKRQLL